MHFHIKRKASLRLSMLSFMTYRRRAASSQPLTKGLIGDLPRNNLGKLGLDDSLAAEKNLSLN
jgi:hypothetical protein